MELATLPHMTMSQDKCPLSTCDRTWGSTFTSTSEDDILQLAEKHVLGAL